MNILSCNFRLGYGREIEFGIEVEIVKFATAFLLDQHLR